MTVAEAERAIETYCREREQHGFGKTAEQRRILERYFEARKVLGLKLGKRDARS